MVVDDAAITSPGNCQVESWAQRTPGQTEYWAVPACNVGGTWEVALGLGRIGPDGNAAYGSGVFQAKTVFHTMEKNGWRIGLTIANQFHQASSVVGDLSLIVPASVSLMDDRVLLHANLGWLRNHAAHRPDALWAMGGEWAARPKLTLTLEAYGMRRGPGFVQAGLRFAVIPDRLAFDAGIGDRAGHFGAERYYTLGLTFAGPAPR